SKANKSSFLTIFDSNLATVIAAAVLFFFGESSVKGFATMLLLGILMIFVTAVFSSRFLLSLLVSSNIFKNQYWLFGVKKNKLHDINEGVDVHDLKTSFEKWNFVKLAKPLIGVSILIVVVGLVILYIFKLNLGIDFSSGTRVDFQSKQAITQQKVEQVVKDSGLKADQIQINGKDNKVATVQFKDDLTRAQDNKLSDN
ncbi:hypothetical protein NMF09_20350, partial [Acinetobacter baumannii]|nr:hypothetical protein [Acinetobacter baumannii]